MKKIKLSLFLLFIFLSSNSFSREVMFSSYLVFGGTTDASADSSDNTSDNSKNIINQAKPDALIYIASKGLQRGVYLEIALIELRKGLTQNMDDMQLAELIAIY